MKIPIFKNMRQDFLNRKTGFTLIETLVAISLLISIVAFMLVMSGSRLNEASALKENLTSEYLGQEVVEGVRSVRDTYYLSHASMTPEELFQGFGALVAQCTGANSTGCTFNPITLAFAQCAVQNCPVYIDPVSGYYGTNTIFGMEQSKFNRYVTIVPNANGVSMDVTVVVENKNAGSTGSVRQTTTINDQLWAWQ